MKNPRLTVFAGAITSLAFMHVMASFFGYATTIIPRVFTFYLSSFLFAVFGIKMIYEGYHMSEKEGQEEFEEVNEELRKREEKESRGDLESGNYRAEVTAMTMMSKIFIQSFTMTTLAEWGDRSQLATVILAAREDVYGVCVGGILGHALCTGLAVIGGRIIATRISVRTVTLVRQTFGLITHRNMKFIFTDRWSCLHFVCPQCIGHQSRGLITPFTQIKTIIRLQESVGAFEKFTFSFIRVIMML